MFIWKEIHMRRSHVDARSNKSLAIQCVSDTGHKEIIVTSYREIRIAGVMIKLSLRDETGRRKRLKISGG